MAQTQQRPAVPRGAPRAEMPVVVALVAESEATLPPAPAQNGTLLVVRDIKRLRYSQGGVWLKVQLG